MFKISSNDIISSLKSASAKGYRLFGEASEMDSYQKIKGHPFLKDYYEDIKAYADSICASKLPDLNFQLFNRFSSDGNRLSYEVEYFKRWKMLFSLVSVTMIDQTDKYIRQIEDYLWNFCDQYSWALPAHLPTSLRGIKESNWPSEEYVDLFAAETAFSLAEIIYLLKDRLNPIVYYRVEKDIDRRVLKPYMGEHMFWWETAKMNWASVCAGSVGCAAIYLVEDEERLTLILQRVLGTLSSYLEGFGEDGATTEGLGYWRYGFGYYVFFAQLLKERTSGAIDLFSFDKIKKIAAFPSSLQLSNGVTVNFSDSLEEFYPNIGLCKLLEQTFGRLGYDYSRCSLYEENETNKWTFLARDLFWGISSDIHIKDNGIEEKSYFSDAQWFIKKQNCPDGGLTAMAAKGGNNDEPHNHNDLGHFILHFKGVNLLSDIGSPEYVKQYFRDETRYGFFTASALSHSVPVIDQKLQMARKSACAKVLQVEDAADFSSFLLDLTLAYDSAALQKYTREFIWNNKACGEGNSPRILQIRDRFIFDNTGNEVIETFVTRYDPEILSNGQIKIACSNAAVLLEYNRDSCAAEVERHEYSDHYGIGRKAYRIVLKLSDTSREKAFDIDFKLI